MLHDHLYHESNINCRQEEHFLEEISPINKMVEQDRWTPTVIFCICNMSFGAFWSRHPWCCHSGCLWSFHSSHLSNHVGVRHQKKKDLCVRERCSEYLEEEGRGYSSYLWTSQIKYLLLMLWFCEFTRPRPDFIYPQILEPWSRSYRAYGVCNNWILRRHWWA